jgi:exonuclease III
VPTRPDADGENLNKTLRNAVNRSIGWRTDHIMATQPTAKRCTHAWIDVDARHAERPSDHALLVTEFDLCACK